MFIGNNFFLRFISFCVWLFIASFFVFALFATIPSDAATVALGVQATEETIQQLRLELGLDQGFFTRYISWLLSILQGDFGKSSVYKIPVIDLVFERLGISLALAAFALFISTVIALPAGLFMAWGQGLRLDRSLNFIFLLFLAIPTFWCAMLLAFLFAVKWQIFPAGGWNGERPLLSLFLPALALSLPQIAIMSRFVRAQTLLIMHKPFIFSALSKGCSQIRILHHHILSNITAPLLTLSGLQFAFLFSGAIVVENIFFLPGIGNFAVQSLLQRDIISLQTVILFFALLLLTLNFVTDQLSRMIDPRPSKDKR